MEVPWNSLGLPCSPSLPYRNHIFHFCFCCPRLGRRVRGAAEGQVPEKSKLSSCDSPSPSGPNVILSLPGSTFLILPQSQTFPCKACISPGNLCPTVSHFLPATVLQSKPTHHAQRLHRPYFFLICFTQVETRAQRGSSIGLSLPIW